VDKSEGARRADQRRTRRASLSFLHLGMSPYGRLSEHLCEAEIWFLMEDNRQLSLASIAFYRRNLKCYPGRRPAKFRRRRLHASSLMLTTRRALIVIQDGASAERMFRSCRGRPGVLSSPLALFSLYSIYCCLIVRLRLSLQCQNNLHHDVGN
jgi:hypothetical protein